MRDVSNVILDTKSPSWAGPAHTTFQTWPRLRCYLYAAVTTRRPNQFELVPET